MILAAEILIWGVGRGLENRSHRETNFCSSGETQFGPGAARKPKALPQEVASPCSEKCVSRGVNAQGWELLKGFQHWTGELD